jgi:hemoglobin/transferrin/lactoferrin receptor protein
VPVIAGIPASVCTRIPRRFPCLIPMRSYQYLNIAEADLSGVELEGAYDWGNGFVTLAATHTDGRNKATRETLVNVPPDRISATLGLRFFDQNLTVGGRLSLVDRRLDVPSGSTILATKAYGVVDLFASYRINERIRADLIVQNLFDKRYTQYLNALQSPGLTVKAAVSIKFATR